MKVSTILIISFFGFLSLNAQSICDEKLQKSQTYLDQGNFSAAFSNIQECLKNAEKSIQWQANRICCLAQLYMAHEDSATQYAREMMRINPSFRTDESSDPKEFIYLINKIELLPVISIGMAVSAGASITTPIPVHVYSNSNIPKSYKSGGSQLIRVSAGYQFLPFLGAELGISAQSKKYYSTVKDVDQVLKITDYLKTADISLGLHIFTPKFYNFQLFANGGTYGSVVANTYADYSAETLSGTPIQSMIHHNTLDRRMSVSFGIYTGLGISYSKQPGWGISANVEFCKGLTNIVKSNMRYSDTRLLYDFLYQEDDIVLNTLLFTVSFNQYLKFKTRVKK